MRCERASALLKTAYAEDVDEVYQLKGGIEKYMQAFPDGGHWRGKNFVFDKREAFGVDNLAGVGGVVRGKKGCAGKDQGRAEVASQCCVCRKPWDRYVGKKKCYTCGVPVLMCDRCLTEKPDKSPGRELEVRCPLCLEEGITTPATDVDFTDNGISVTTSRNSEKKGPAAKSVLKWGGGVAKEKKEKKKKRSLTSLKSKVCKFGAACYRQDCYFFHPGREPLGRSATDEESIGESKKRFKR